MMIRKLQYGPFAERARRSAREIMLAVALTFAALMFVGTAFHRSTPETASVPASRQQHDRTPMGAQPVEGQAAVPAPSWQASKDL